MRSTGWIHRTHWFFLTVALVVASTDAIMDAITDKNEHPTNRS